MAPRAVLAAAGLGGASLGGASLGQSGVTPHVHGGASGPVLVGVAGVGVPPRVCPNLRVRMTGVGVVVRVGVKSRALGPGPLASGRGAEAPAPASAACASWAERVASRRAANARAADRLESTGDAADRAHAVYEGELLASARRVPHARARRYHPAYMVGPLGQRVSVETALERVAASAARCGLGRGPSVREAVAASLGRLAAVSEGAARGVVEGGRLRERWGEGEAERRERAAAAAHERAVAALLASVRAGGGGA